MPKPAEGDTYADADDLFRKVSAARKNSRSDPWRMAVRDQIGVMTGRCCSAGADDKMFGIQKRQPLPLGCGAEGNWSGKDARRSMKRPKPWRKQARPGSRPTGAWSKVLESGPAQCVNPSADRQHWKADPTPLPASAVDRPGQSPQDEQKPAARLGRGQRLLKGPGMPAMSAIDGSRDPCLSEPWWDPLLGRIEVLTGRETRSQWPIW
jgi:hypothetical protein